MPPIAIEPREWEELSVILRERLPGRKVWAFGSRATRVRLKRFSDLDLAIDGNELSLDQRAKLSEALDESRLPFKVDIVELSSITPEFRKSIETEIVLVQNNLPGCSPEHPGAI